MADTKISAAADIGTVAGTDKVPVARVASTTAYYCTMTEIAAFAPVQSVGGHTGTVTLAHTDITDWAATLLAYAPLASPTFTGLITQTPSAGLTAHAGGGQASALALTLGVNYVTTVATVADSVRLPASIAGEVVEVINSTTNALQVFGAGTDTINGVATGTGVSLAAGKLGYYRCPVAGKWFGGALA